MNERTSLKVPPGTITLLRTLAAQLTISEGRQVSMGEVAAAAARLAGQDIDALRSHLASSGVSAPG